MEWWSNIKAVVAYFELLPTDYVMQQEKWWKLLIRIEVQFGDQNKNLKIWNKNYFQFITDALENVAG